MLESVAMEIDTKASTRLKDIGGIFLFVIAVLVGAWLINVLVFRSFNVEGPSMEETLHTRDRLIVNRLPVTWSNLRSTSYIPERGQIIVFKNPRWRPGEPNEYVVKRVIAFPGERVVISNGKVLVYNSDNPDGIDVDKEHPGAIQPTDSSEDTVVPEGQIYVLGDHRQAGYSCDSRNSCLGTIPFGYIIGPVSMRIFPLDKMTFF